MMSVSDQNPVFELTEQHLKLLRAVVFFWAEGGDNGVPMFYGYSTTDHSGGDLDNLPYLLLDRYTDMARILGLPLDPNHLSPDEQAQLDNLHEELGQALEVFLVNAQLTPGEYIYPNWLKQVSNPMLPALFRTWERYGQWRTMPPPVEDTLTVPVTEDHLNLLRVLRIRWDKNFYSYYGVWEKRPYGDMTTPELDMATTLGISKVESGGNELGFTEDQMRYFYQLHTDMLYVLPVFLHYGQLAPGHYSL